MRRILAAIVGVTMVICAPYTLFPGQPDWFKLSGAEATKGHGGSGGSHGGNHGGGEGGSHGGSSHGGGSTPSGVSAPTSVSGPNGAGGAIIVGGGSGISKGDRDKLVAAVKMCEMERPGLALGDVTYLGGWSFRTYDDTVWPYVQRCMKKAGYPANGTDYSEPSNFGQRSDAGTEHPVVAAKAVKGKRKPATTKGA